MAKPGKRLHFANRDQWRAWLQENHATRKEIWLIHYKKHTGKAGISLEEAVEEALCFGWIDGLLRRVDDERYALRYTPRRKKSIWSETNKKRARKMIRQGRMTEAGLARIREAKQSGEWDRASQREDPTQIPADLKKALAADEKAREFFEKLAPSHRKQFIWWITSAKRDETRAKRIKETVRLARQSKKPGMQ